jgi:hypothetical protein
MSARSGWLLLLFPALLCGLNPDWIYTNPYILPWFDPFVYLGAFQYLPQALDVSPRYYPLERLPFLVPGYLLYRVLPPIAANFVLHSAFFLLTCSSLFYLVRRTLGGNAAWLAVLFLGFHPVFLMAVGMDYVDGAALAYVSGALAASYAAAVSGRAAFLALSGFLTACMLFCHALFLALVPIPWIFYLAARGAETNQRIGFREFGHATLLFGFGGLVLTLLGGAINVTLGGDFLFFKSQLHLGGSIVAAEQSLASYHGRGEAMKKAVWNSLPLVSLVLAGSYFVSVRFLQPRCALSRETTFARIFLLMCVGVVALFLVTHFSLHAVLAFHFYASLLVPFCVLVFAVFGRTICGTLSGRSARSFLLIVCALLALGFVPAVGGVVQGYIGPTFGRVWFFVPALYLLGGIVLAWVFRRYAPVAAVWLGLGMALGNISQTNQAQLNFLDRPARRDGFATIVEITREFQFRLDSRSTGFLVDRAHPVYGNNLLYAMWIANHRRSGRFSPPLLRDWNENALAQTDEVFVVTSGRKGVQRIVGMLADKGYVFDIRSRRVFQNGDIRMFGTVIAKRSSSPAGFAADGM